MKTTARRGTIRRPTMLACALFAASALGGQQTQKAVNVRLPSTESALDIAEANEPNAATVSVTGDGTTYFGVTPMTPDALATELSHRSHEKKVFIKADASAPYVAVESAVNAVRNAGFSDCIFLTSQYEMPAGSRILPKGLEVWLKSTVRPKTPRVELTKGSESAPTLKINGRPVAWSSLQNTLTTILGNQIDRKAVIKAEGMLPFEQIMHAIDVANSIGADVILQPQS